MAHKLQNASYFQIVAKLRSIRYDERGKKFQDFKTAPKFDIKLQI